LYSAYDFTEIAKYGCKREEETGCQRKVHNEELHNLFFLPIFRARLAEHVACTGERRGSYRVLVEKPKKTSGWRL
jgi:hypothetical protein